MSGYFGNNALDVEFHIITIKIPEKNNLKLSKMNHGRDNSLLARQSEAIRQMLTLNEATSVIFTLNGARY